jgi:nickel transport protein
MMLPQKILLVSALASLSFSTLAHTVWLEPVNGKAGDYRVMFGGHAGKLEQYNPQKLKTIDAYDASGGKLNAKRSVEGDAVRLHVEGAPAMIAMHFDNGIHTRTENGPSVEKPMNEVPGATRATNAIKYHKTIVQWSPLVTKPINQPFEVIPLDSTQPVAGKPLRVQVRQDGKPVAGIKLGRGEEGSPKDPVTDSNGVASFVPEKGFNKLWAGKRIPVSNDPKYTELSYEYLFGFDAQ